MYGKVIFLLSYDLISFELCSSWVSESREDVGGSFGE